MSYVFKRGTKTVDVIVFYGIHVYIYTYIERNKNKGCKKISVVCQEHDDESLLNYIVYEKKKKIFIWKKYIYILATKENDIIEF